MRIVALLATTTAIVAIAAPAMAGAAWPNWYLGIRGGVAFLSDSDISGPAFSGKTEYDTGYSLSGAIGYRPGFAASSMGSMRVEAEYLYQTNSLGSGNALGVPVSYSGDIAHSAILLNAYYDFALTNSRFSPYLGAGLGLGHSRASDIKTNGVALIDDSDNGMAYDLMAGIGYSPETVPYTTFSLGYRYFGMQDSKYNIGATNVKVDNDSHNVEAGAQFRF